MSTTADESSYPLRIACLEPSATAICLELGLQDCIVGVTHECHELVQHNLDPSRYRVLTKNGLTVTNQGEIHQAVEASAAAATTATICPLPSLKKGDQAKPSTSSIEDIPSLYPLLADQIQAANPNVIFTQNLCAVCAPTESDVLQLLLDNKTSKGADGTSSSSSSSSSQHPSQNSNGYCQVVSLQPQTLQEVADTFVTVAKACGIQEKGSQLQESWMSKFQRLQDTIERHRDQTIAKPRLLILEWLDPPFDGGHWTFQMMDFAGVVNANTSKVGPKSKAMDWKAVQEMDPDVIVVGCCGFDLERNIADVHEYAIQFEGLRATQCGRVYACNGNIYIAQPSPSLLQGATVLAKCAYQDQPKVLEEIDALDYFDVEEDKAWQHVNVLEAIQEAQRKKTKKTKSHLFQRIATTQPMMATNGVNFCSSGPGILDMEDLVGGEVATSSNPGDEEPAGFALVHRRAVEQGKRNYIDPVTGYSVFTELAHKERGWCCGSGCRHCPYSHENVQDKASKIQQPSIMVRRDDANGEEHDMIFSLEHKNIKVLFFSGGKDSFLTIRSLVRQYYQEEKNGRPFGLVLFTTFDATTRTIAHQNIPIDQVVRQAKHLNLTLLGIPLRRGSGETYLERIIRAIAVLEQQLDRPIASLVFGDLHLAHIQEWRDKTFRDVPHTLEYPLWKVPYEKLMKDLEDSQVPCEISGSTVPDMVAVGTPFDRSLYNRSIQLGLDGFGECGEFHSLAKVWEVPRAKALGLLQEE